MANPRILYESRFTDAPPVASSTAAGAFNVANLTDWRDTSWWQPLVMPANVTVDSAAAAAVDYWLVWGHDLGSTGATIELHKSNDNFVANDVLVDSVTPADDKPFARYVTTADERYWRIVVTGATAPSLAIVTVGSYLQLPAGLRDGFDPLGRTPKGRFNRSVKGHPLGRTIDYETWTTTLDFDLVAWDWVRANWLPAWAAHLKGAPFVFSWAPVNYPAELRYVNAVKGFDTPHHPGSRTGLKVELEGLFA